MQPTDQDAKVQNENQTLTNRVNELLFELSSWAQELKRRNLEFDLLNRMGYALQKCQTPEDILNLLPRFIFRLFAEQPGELFLMDENKQILEKSTTWGELHKDPALLRKEYCQPFQRRQLCSFQDGSELNCAFHQTLFASENPEVRYICAPILYKDRMIGMLHQHLPELTPILKSMSWLDDDHWKNLADAICERLAGAFIAVSNGNQKNPKVYRDPLTNLFNRWYMQETLERELSFARRHSAPLWVFNLDIDRMKKVNEHYGFQTGDDFLRKLSEFLMKHIRAEDVICRSGGDEFTMILLGMPGEKAYERAQALREGIKELQVATPNLYSIGATCSFGLAGFPGHGEKGPELLQAAGQALKTAKKLGRDQVQIAA